MKLGQKQRVFRKYYISALGSFRWQYMSKQSVLYILVSKKGSSCERTELMKFEPVMMYGLL